MTSSHLFVAYERQLLLDNVLITCSKRTNHSMQAQTSWILMS